MNRWMRFKYWWWRNFGRRVISISFEGDPYGPETSLLMVQVRNIFTLVRIR